MQFQFTCPECRRSGLTPEIADAKALAVALKLLHLRCPACSAIVEVTEPLAGVLWETYQKFSDGLRATFEAELGRIAAEAERAQKERQQNAAPDGGPAGRSGNSHVTEGPPPVS
jgi:hypothetical protein